MPGNKVFSSGYLHVTKVESLPWQMTRERSKIYCLHSQVKINIIVRGKKPV
jgi:hypothetical protein